MRPAKSSIKQFFCAALLCFAAFVSTIHAQQNPGQTPPHPADDVVRINTDLVQTDVMVFDKSGRFVDNLTRDQFLLTVDGKPQPISFFERVTAGSINEEAQLAAARGAQRAVISKNAVSVKPLDRGRAIFFFVDDLHLAADSVARARKLILRFVDDEMGQNDQAAIVSTSGQTGFLGQLTDNKTVLRAAAARLVYRNRTARAFERPPMSEYQALAIDRNDLDAIGYFVDALIRENPGMRRDAAESMVTSRARQILQEAAYLTTNTLATLDSLVRSLAKLPGRKIGFFISDGFFLDTRTSDVTGRLRRITDGAARSGTVLYTMDARGLSTGLPDASSDVAFDPSGRLSRVDMGEMAASQEALYTLAADTGGRALLNTNALDKALTKSLKETSVYYLLAWQPEHSDGRGSSKFRTIKVSVTDRPELTVIARRGFYLSPPELPAAKRSKKKSSNKPEVAEQPSDKSPDGELRAALSALYPQTELPVALSVGYNDAPDSGTVLTAAIQLILEKIDSPATDATPKAIADVVSVIFDNQGKPISSIKDQITITPTNATAAQSSTALFSHQFRLTPGLYQVRVAARDSRTGRIGSAIQWIEIPKIASGEFALSSLFIGERMKEQTQNSETPKPAAPAPIVMISADHHFKRASQLRFLTFVYNAAQSTVRPPDVGVQVQVFRDDQPVITAPLSKVNTSGVADLTRLPYAAEIPLDRLPVGQYALQVTAIDRAAKATASQRISFVIE